jgi:hypothetical protein
VVAPAEFRTFANSPFRLLKAVEAQEPGVDERTAAASGEMPALEVPAAANIVDEFLLLGLLRTLGSEALLSLLNLALSCSHLGVAAGAFRNRLTAGMLSCLPVGCRTEFSFTTGLKYSSQRPFRLSCLPDDAAECRRLSRRYGVEVWSLQQQSADSPAQHPWVEVLRRVIRANALAEFCRKLAEFPPSLGTSDLPDLARTMLAEWSGEKNDMVSQPEEPAAHCGLEPASV